MDFSPPLGKPVTNVSLLLEAIVTLIPNEIHFLFAVAGYSLYLCVVYAVMLLSVAGFVGLLSLAFFHLLTSRQRAARHAMDSKIHTALAQDTERTVPSFQFQTLIRDLSPTYNTEAATPAAAVAAPLKDTPPPRIPCH